MLSMFLRSRLRAVLLGPFLWTLLLTYPLQAAPPTVQQWREDLAYLSERLRQLHPNVYHAVSPDEFEKMVVAIDKRIPELQPHEIIVEFIRLVAAVGDGHSRFNVPSPRPDFTPADPSLYFHRLPILLEFFSDGLFIRAADESYAATAGARVVKIGNVDLEEALERASALASRDRVIQLGLVGPELVGERVPPDQPLENTGWIKYFMAFHLTVPEILHALRITPDKERASFQIVKRDGAVETIEFTSLDEGREPKWINPREQSQNPLPLWHRNNDKHYWFEYLAESKTVYVQYNSVLNMKGESIYQFSSKLFKFIDANPVERLILDMRHNGGGNNTLNRPLVHGLEKRDAINRRGGLFVITSRRTFSAAMNCVNDLDQQTNALFVGEPTGAAPNSFGDARPFKLPHSGLDGRISTLLWADSDPRDKRPWVAPEIPAPLSSEDYFSNRDPALEAIFNYEP